MTSKILIIVLVLIALVLGIMIYQATTLKTSQRPTTGEIAPPGKTSSATLPRLPAVPGPDASNAEKATFGQAIQNLAKESNTMEIGAGCALSPLVARVSEGDGFIFKNNDKVSHLIIILDQYTIPAGGAHAITAKFEKGAGIYGVVCADSNIKGFMEVVARTK